MSAAGEYESWATRAEAVGRKLPMKCWESEAREYLSARPMGSVWAVGCSGGADSLALLLTMWANFPNRRQQLQVWHFNHGIRGAESAGDAAFVQSVAAGLGIPFESALRPQEGNREGLASQPSRSSADLPSEASLREARMHFFEEVAGRLQVEVLLLGHQRDDVAESLLWRMARGSSTAGLAGPRPVQCFKHGAVRVRPLLTIGAEEIRSVLRQCEIPWREDSTNQVPVCLRNHLRLRVLPMWRSAGGPDPSLGAALTRRWCAEDDAALEEWLDRAGLSWRKGQPMNRAALIGLPAALWRRALHRWLAAQGLHSHFSRASFETLLEAVRAGTPWRLSAGSGWVVGTTEGTVCWEGGDPEPLAPPWSPQTLAIGEALEGPDGSTLAAGWMRLEAPDWEFLREGRLNPAEEVWLSPAVLGPGGGLEVRRWESKDRYLPLGAPGADGIGEWLAKRKIPRRERNGLPAVCNEAGELLWVPGLPPAEMGRLAAGTGVALRLTYRQSGTEYVF